MSKKKSTLFGPSIPKRKEFNLAKTVLHGQNSGIRKSRDGIREMHCQFSTAHEVMQGHSHFLHNLKTDLSVESEQLNSLVNLQLNYAEETEKVFTNLSKAFEVLDKRTRKLEEVQQKILSNLQQMQKYFDQKYTQVLYGQEDSSVQVFKEINREHNTELTKFKADLFNFFEEENKKPKHIEQETKSLLEKTNFLLEQIDTRIIPLVTPVNIQGDLS